MESKPTFESVTAALRGIGECAVRVHRNEGRGGRLSPPWLSADYSAESWDDALAIAGWVRAADMPWDSLAINAWPATGENTVCVTWHPRDLDHPMEDTHIVPCVVPCDSLSRGAP